MKLNNQIMAMAIRSELYSTTKVHYLSGGVSQQLMQSIPEMISFKARLTA